MRTISITLSEQQFLQYGFTESPLTLEELLKKLKKELALQALRKARQSASKAGLDKMTLAEINAEIKAVRNAKARH